MDNRPIGVFDSGLGGLTAVRALRALLPGEDIVYFGDTGRVPYGNRSAEIIEQYAKDDIAVLKSHNVKYILAACGTVSSNTQIETLCGDTPSTGVIYPAVKEAIEISAKRPAETYYDESGKESYLPSTIGVIATTATINSKAYKDAISMYGIPVAQNACPLFVPLVENGYIERDNLVTNLVAQEYLLPLLKEKISTLILGCTHYPLLADIIGDILGESVTLIDSGAAAARHATKYLKEHNMLCDRREGDEKYFVSDFPQAFTKTAEIFIKKHISATQIKPEDYRC